MITGEQIRAARALFGSKQSNLAERSGVSEISIKNIERGAPDPRASTVQSIQATFDRADVVFLEPAISVQEALARGSSGAPLHRSANDSALDMMAFSCGGRACG